MSREDLLTDLGHMARMHSDATVMFHSAIAAELGLGVTDEKLLSLLEQKGPSTAGQLGRVAGLAPSSLTTALDRLERRGFIVRHRDPDDHRRVIVAVEPQLFEVAAPMFHGLVHQLDAIHDRLSDKDLRVVLDYLTHASTALQQATAEVGRHSTATAVRQFLSSTFRPSTATDTPSTSEA